MPNEQVEGGQALSRDEARELAEEAYAFAFPLVYTAIQADVQTQAVAPEGMLAPLNQFAHYRERPDATYRAIVGVNLDTLYSLAVLDLSAEPLVLSIPEMADRWWLMQLIDSWNEVFGAPGARTVGGAGGDFALVGPSWTGSLPPGLREFRSSTNTAFIGGRTYLAGKADLPAVHRLQDRYTLTPLSRWGKPYTPPARSPLKPGVDRRTTVPEQVLALPAEAFFKKFCALLTGTRPRSLDAPVLARIARLGLVPGAAFSFAPFSPEVREAIEDGVSTVKEPIRVNDTGGVERARGWQLNHDFGKYGTDYRTRARVTCWAFGANLPEDALYPLAIEDADGQPLSGDGSYVLRFSGGQLPPVNTFWSLTIYDEQSWLVPNPIDRYSLGDRDPLKRDADGSISLYIQREAPDGARMSNWLPCPEGKFLVALRLYWPKQAILDGTWKPPGIEKIH